MVNQKGEHPIFPINVVYQMKYYVKRHRGNFQLIKLVPLSAFYMLKKHISMKITDSTHFFNYLDFLYFEFFYMLVMFKSIIFIIGSCLCSYSSGRNLSFATMFLAQWNKTCCFRSTIGVRPSIMLFYVL